MSHVYKTGTAQSQQITTFAKLPIQVNPKTYTPQCPLCLTHTHDTNYFFNHCQVPTQHHATSLWKKPLEVEVIQEKSRLAFLKGKEMALLRYSWRAKSKNKFENSYNF